VERFLPPEVRDELRSFDVREHGLEGTLYSKCVRSDRLSLPQVLWRWHILNWCLASRSLSSRLFRDLESVFHQSRRVLPHILIRAHTHTHVTTVRRRCKPNDAKGITSSHVSQTTGTWLAPLTIRPTTRIRTYAANVCFHYSLVSCNKLTSLIEGVL
jgi:hypothetical protein